MSCIYECKFTCHQIQHSFKRRDKQSFAVGLAEQVVNFRKHFAQIPPRLRMIFDQGLTDHHKEGSRNSFS